MRASVQFLLILLISFITNYLYSKSLKVPKNFELQTLEPIGGKIPKPKNWFFVEKHQNSNSLGWIISKENFTKGPYETGMRIQFFIGIKDKTGQTPKEFVYSFINKKKKEPKVKLLHSCTEIDQGRFIHTCIEVEEPINLAGKKNNYHIQYTLFWAKTMDMVVFTISGTTTDKWEENREIFETMSFFQLVDGDTMNEILN